MYYFSDWFKSISLLSSHFERVIRINRGVEGWQTHCTPSGLEYKSLYHSYETKPISDCVIESHRNTIDLQYCYAGGELIGYGEIALVSPTRISYDKSKDKETWLSGAGLINKVHLVPNSYVLFRPNQLHQPQESDGINSGIEKIVLKLPASMKDLS